MRMTLESILSKTANRKALFDWAGNLFGRINDGAARAATAARKHTNSATEYLRKHKRGVAGIGGLGGIGAGAMFITPEMAETMSSVARTGYVYGRRALRLDDAVSAANGEQSEGR